MVFSNCAWRSILGPSLRWDDGGGLVKLRHPSAGWDPESEDRRAFLKQLIFRQLRPRQLARLKTDLKWNASAVMFNKRAWRSILGPSLRWDDGGGVKDSVIPAQAGIQNLKSVAHS